MKSKMFGSLVGCLLILSATTARAGDRLYLVQDTGTNDTLQKVNSLTRGVFGGGLGSEPGFVSAGTGTDNIGDIDAANINGAPIVVTAGNVAHTWDADIGFLNVADLNGPAPDIPVREVVIGEYGGNSDRIVFARESSVISTDILITVFEASTLSFQSQPGPIGGIGNVSGMELGDFDSTKAGNELVLGTTDLSTLAKSGFHVYYSAGGFLGQQSLGQPISDVGAGDLSAAHDDWESVLTGNIGGDPGPGTFGQQTHVFSPHDPIVQPPTVDFVWENGGGGPHGDPNSAPGALLFNAVDVGQLDDDPELEIALVGNNVVRILNHDGSFAYQSGPTGQNFVDVVIADAMDNDGVNELVAVSDSGLVFAFGHTIVGDASSPYDGGALGFFNGGASGYTAITALNPVPEPAAALLMLLGSVGALGFRRR